MSDAILRYSCQLQMCFELIGNAPSLVVLVPKVLFGLQIIQEYENGKAIPAPAVLSKLSRVLGVQLSAKKK